MMPEYTLGELQEARRVARVLKLDGWELFCHIPLAGLQKIANGIGAEWQNPVVRKILDKRFRDLQIAAMIHDMLYVYGAGTSEDFLNANETLRTNGRKLAAYYHSWYSPVRWLCVHDAYKLAAVCDMFGRKAYDDAVALHRKEQEARA